MTRFVGLDVSQKITAICIVDNAGRRLWRGQCPTVPEQISVLVRRHGGDDARIGIETGAMTPWLAHELRNLGLEVVCLDARHARAALEMQINKTDQNDAEGLAQPARARRQDARPSARGGDDPRNASPQPAGALARRNRRRARRLGAHSVWFGAADSPRPHSRPDRDEGIALDALQEFRRRTSGRRGGVRENFVFLMSPVGLKVRLRRRSRALAETGTA